jgi:hypothetical protein
MIDKKIKRKIGKKKKLKLVAVVVEESTLHRASGSEDARFHQLNGASIDLDGIGCGITAATSTGEGWPITTTDRSPDSMNNKALF